MLKGFEEKMLRVSDLLQRSRAARGEFSKRTAHPMPKSRVRFQVLVKGPGSYQVVEAETGDVRRELPTYKEAMNYAQRLEAWADQRVAV